MPVSSSFKDLSVTFAKHPVSNDLLSTKDFAAIKQSIQNIITTIPGERFFEPSLGSNITDLLFEPIDDITATSIKFEVEYVINAFEPRVKLNEVRSLVNYDLNGYDIEIDYSVIGLAEKLQSVELFLERTRA